MPTPHRPLPPGFQGVAFSVAQGRPIGLGQTRMRSGDLARPFRGIRVTAPLGVQAPPVEHDPVDRYNALSVIMPPSGFFSHVTAARLWPLSLPRPEPEERVHRPARPPRRSGVSGHLAPIR
jgi:hypothetical protein